MVDRVKLIVFGAGGHAKVIVDMVERLGGHEIVCLVSGSPVAEDAKLFGYPVVMMNPEIAGMAGGTAQALIAIGDNRDRARLAAELESRGWGFATIIHPAAVIGRGVNIGAGSVVMAGCVINADSQLGRHVIVNTGATVDHDCVVGDGVHIGPGCHLCGAVMIGKGSFLGAGTIAIPGIRIGEHAITGAGASVIDNISDHAKVIGIPARSMR